MSLVAFILPLIGLHLVHTLHNIFYECITYPIISSLFKMLVRHHVALGNLPEWPMDSGAKNVEARTQMDALNKLIEKVDALEKKLADDIEVFKQRLDEVSSKLVTHEAKLNILLK